MTQIAEIKSKRTETDKNALRKLYGIRESVNPMLDLPVDLYT